MHITLVYFGLLILAILSHIPIFFMIIGYLIYLAIVHEFKFIVLLFIALGSMLEISMWF